MWELDYKEGWAPKNWCFWTVVLGKTLESPLDCKEIQPVHSKGDQSWVFIGRTDVEAETPILWPLDAKNRLIWKDPDAGKDWGQEEKRTTEDEMLDGITDSMDMGLGWLRESVMDKEDWRAVIHGVTKSHTRLGSPITTTITTTRVWGTCFGYLHQDPGHVHTLQLMDTSFKTLWILLFSDLIFVDKTRLLVL